MKNSRVFIDLHVIQTVPPSNINRDDTGSPKTAQYGGVTRARVSSQSWKKAMRSYFNNENEGIRSLNIPEYIAENIMEIDSSVEMEKALEMANKVLNDAKVSTKDNKVKALFFISKFQARDLAQAAIDGITDKKHLQKILKDKMSVDIALFGRMVADDPTLNEDASCQVAHSISTHGVETEFDFYTATDDLSKEDNAGAGMLGTLEFNASTLYRYANVAVHELKVQLGDKDATLESVKLFVESFVKSMPTGKINSYANQTLPQALMVSVRTDRPINLVTAFEKPVKSRNGYTIESIEKLKTEYNNVLNFVDEPIHTFTVGIDDIGERKNSLNDLISNLLDSICPLLP